MARTPLSLFSLRNRPTRHEPCLDIPTCTGTAPIPPDSLYCRGRYRGTPSPDQIKQLICLNLSLSLSLSPSLSLSLSRPPLRWVRVGVGTPGHLITVSHRLGHFDELFPIKRAAPVLIKRFKDSHRAFLLFLRQRLVRDSNCHRHGDRGVC